MENLLRRNNIMFHEKERKIKSILNEPFNHKCIDCNKKNPDYISLNNAKILYKQGDLWLLADDVDKSINHTMELVKQNEELMKNCIVETKEDIKTISDDIDKADKHNEGLKDDIKDILKWGE